jgi:hypothetical protein
MTTTRKSQPFDIFSAFTETTAPSQIAARQVDSWLKAQAEVLNGLEAITDEWLKRRREGNEAAIEAVEKMCSCKDVNDMLVVYFDWLGGSVRRLTEDASAMSERYVSLAARAVSAGQAAAAEAARPAGKAPAAARPAPKARPAEKAEKPERIERVEKIVKTEHAA